MEALGATRAKHSWPLVRLGDVCDEIRERISSDNVTEANYVTTDNMLKGCGGIRPADSVPAGTSLVRYTKGDMLLSNIRPYLKKVWMADRTGGCSSDVIVLRNADNNLAPEYLFRILSQDGFFDYVMQNVNGTKMPRGKRDWIKRFQFPLPPLPVQREIVARLERELAKADSLAANFKRIAELADAEFRAELDEAFIQLVGKTVRLEDKCKISYGYTGEAVSGLQEALPKYLRITDIQNNAVEWERVPACKCPNFEKFRLLQGDIVFARTGATTGKSYLLQGDFPRAVYASYLIRLRIQDTSIDPHFLKYYFGTSKYWDTIEAGMAGAAQGGFNSTKLGALTVAIPSRDEQRKTVAQLNAASEQCEKLKTAAMYGATRVEALRAAILSEAFT